MLSLKIPRFSPFLEIYKTPGCIDCKCTLVIWHPFLPSPSMVRSVRPSHFALSMAQIIKELANINISVPPFHLSVPTLLIIFILSFVNIPMGRSPFALPVFKTVFEHPFEDVSILPIVLPIPIRGISLVMPLEEVSISERLYSIAVFDKLLEFSFIFSTVC